MFLSNGKISQLATPTELRQQFNCGYLIDIEDQYPDNLINLLEENHFPIKQIPATERRAEFVIPAERHVDVSSILRRLSFPFILTIQSLEQKFFEEIQNSEGKQALEDEEDGMNDQNVSDIENNKDTENL